MTAPDPITPRFPSSLGAAALAACIAVALGLAPVPGAEPPAAPPAERRKTPSRNEIDQALRARDFAKAEELIAARLAADGDIGDGDDPRLLYDHACALAQLGRLREAEEQLLASVRAGFSDLDHLESDPDLEPIRESRTYSAIMEARERIESRKPTGKAAKLTREPAPDPLARWKATHGDAYRYEVDAESGLAFATFLDDASHARMKETLARLERHLLDAYFRKPPAEIALVAIVRPADADRYLERPEIRGMYLHRERRLVARDTGQSLQHEFVHLLHYADMQRLGQLHPIWIQEGLASLYEDYTLRDDGRVEFHPNIRFNIARRQVLADAARDWRELMRMSPDTFMADAEAHYPQARAMFEFFARERKLESFYRELVATAKDDPTGIRAVERAFEEPLAKVEARWRVWMRERGAVDDRVARGDASLGVSVEDVGGGVRIRSFAPGSAARAAGLRVGDVVYSVAGVPVRNRDELVLAVARLRLGETVEVRFRRHDSDAALMVSPRPLG